MQRPSSPRYEQNPADSTTNHVDDALIIVMLFAVQQNNGKAEVVHSSNGDSYVLPRRRTNLFTIPLPAVPAVANDRKVLNGRNHLEANAVAAVGFMARTGSQDVPSHP
ncbi:hypothetical protein J2X20_000791 [Pelomonas saccharophila]|jgi:hypothetical protein|uniref:Uncharacterized protein n=1 Tax=Roseateles saccharophilus TaxID=304 RepID=A0ABU1YH17_ROSSA|nr:hypothetical protein [Roseateles saccharophilus]MDR7268162.1 hypothetical protein [Roseateles saccharophilus]